MTKILYSLLIIVFVTNVNSSEAEIDIKKYVSKEYKIYVGDPSGVRGSKEIEWILVQPVAVVHGPVSPNWQPADILFKLVNSVKINEELIEYVTVSPRYTGVTFKEMLEMEAQVGVGRVLPGKVVTTTSRYKVSDIEYWAIGTIRPSLETTN